MPLVSYRRLPTFGRMPRARGQIPFRRTLEFLQGGKTVLKKSVKTVAIYLTRDESGTGLRNFVLRDLPQIHYKNPKVQFITFNQGVKFPQLKLFFDDTTQLMIDTDGKTADEIVHLLDLTGGATKSELEKRSEEQYPGRSNPANFGRFGHCFCMCEKPGQVPCPSRVALPESMRVHEWHKKGK